jgi:hypothetical protein
VDLLRFSTVGGGEPSTLVWEAVGFVLFTGATFWMALRALYAQE